jgi:hypothetical protein
MCCAQCRETKADTLKATEANRRRGPGTREKVRTRRINLEGNTHAQEINVSQLPAQLSLSQLAKTLVPSYYGLYALFNKIRDKGKIVSDWYQRGGGEKEGAEWVVREGVGAEGRNDPSLVCTYE